VIGNLWPVRTVRLVLLVEEKFLCACSASKVMHSKSSHHKKHKKDKKKHKHKSRHSDEGSHHHHKKRKRKHAEAADGSATSDVIYIDDGAHSVKQLRLDDDNSLQVIMCLFCASCFLFISVAQFCNG